MIEAISEKGRSDLELVGNYILEEKTNAMNREYDVKENEDRGEVIANLVLAYRHIEDARMRLGKVYQARNGGVSNSTR